MGRLVAFAVAVAVTLAALRAGAEPTSEERALATALFKEGRRLIEENRVPEACRKFEESQRLDPSGGTLLNLGVCHEREGRLASAWTELSEALSMAIRDGREDRATLARERIAAIEPRLSRLVVIVAPAVDAPGLEVRRDGSLVGRAAWGTAMPVDPGDHVVEVSAPGKRAWSARVTIGPERDTKQIEVPPLEDLPAPPPSPEPKVSPVVVAPPPQVDPDKPRRARRTLGYVTGGVGLVGIGVGAYFGLRAIAKRHDSDALCPAGRCTNEGAALNDQAKTAADVSTVAIAVGAPLVALGLYFVLTLPAPAARASVRVAPEVGRDRAALTIVGAF